MTECPTYPMAGAATSDPPTESPRGPATCLARALARPRYELIPIKGVEDEVEHLPPEATATVMCSPTKGVEPTIAVCERLAETFEGHVVPHLSARTVHDRRHLAQILERLDRAGIREAFVIGGDATRPAGPYPSAWHLLLEMEALGHGLKTIGVAAYPESHPHIDGDELARALEAKQRWASYMVTQMCFDPETIAGWVHQVRERGVTLPVYVGVAGPIDKAKLLKICMKIGVRDCQRFLAKHKQQVGQMIQAYDPGELLMAMAPALADESSRIAGFHVYAFNQLAGAERWRRELIAHAQADGSDPVRPTTPSAPPPG